MTKDIVLICDDNYSFPTAVCVQSIVDNVNKNLQLNVHVCTFGLTLVNEQMIKKISSPNIKVEVNVFDKREYESKIHSVSQKSHVSPAALIKFELANYFTDLDSVLYLDSDIIIKGDLTELLNTDVSDYYIAASYEFWKHINRLMYSLQRSMSSDFYFNSGVMLLNLKKYREDNIPDKLWYHKLNMTKTKLMDQESLNSVCGSKVLPLSVKWNFNPVFLDNRFLKEIRKVYGEAYSTPEDLEENIRIIHYVGAADKPWVYKNAKMRSYWDSAYFNTHIGIKLQDKELDQESFLNYSFNRVKKYGVWGSICYLLYKIQYSFLKK